MEKAGEIRPLYSMSKWYKGLVYTGEYALVLGSVKSRMRSGGTPAMGSRPEDAKDAWVECWVSGWGI
jgi:hypothetical protein